MGEFVDSGGEILSGAYVDSALANYTAFESHFTQREAVQYYSGWDLARKQTATVGVTIEVANGLVRVVMLERFQKFDWDVVVEKIKQRQHRYPGKLLVDATGLGDVIVEQLRGYKPEAVHFTEMVKAELLSNVEYFHATQKIGYGSWTMPDKNGAVWSLEDELREARWDKNNTCDALMALALALWPLRLRTPVEPLPRIGKIK